MQISSPKRCKVLFMSRFYTFFYCNNKSKKLLQTDIESGIMYAKSLSEKEGGIMHDTAVEMAKRLLVDSIWKSANLEGLGTTFPKTEAILANAPTETRSEEVLFVVNMKRAWQFLLKNLNVSNNIMLLREYNRIVGELMFGNNGEIRTFPVQIGGTSWEPELPNSAAIIENLHKIDEIDDVELKALKFFCFVARTQMFVDGNKRVAQLIANKVLIENDAGIFQIPIEKLEQFKMLLIGFYETDDDADIIAFMQEFCIKRVWKI